MTSTSTNCARNWTTSRSRRRKADARRARSASSPDSRRYSGLSRNTVAPRNMGKIATFSSGCMPCALTACARLRSVVPCSCHWIIKGCSPARKLSLLRRRRRLSDDELLAELKGAAGAGGITELRHVRKSADKRAAEEIANRTVCEDFEKFEPIFERVKRELKSGIRHTLPVQTMDEIKMAEIQKGEYFIVQGQIAYVAEVGEDFRTQYDRRDSRLRVIYDNGTESNLLMRSFQRALHRDAAGRLITNPDTGPLFAEEPADDDLASGTIYVLRSKSDHPVVAANRDVLHKIGVTGSKVETRIANANLDPTFLMADVEVIATYELYNINRIKLENLIHRVFDPAQLDIEIRDRFGNPVKPREWFLVPLFVVNEVVERIKDGTITQYVYDPTAARLVKVL